jgi:hypothetical protein
MLRSKALSPLERVNRSFAAYADQFGGAHRTEFAELKGSFRKVRMNRCKESFSSYFAKLY